MARAEEGRRLASGDQVRSNANRRASLAKRLRRRVGHGDDIGGLDDLETELLPVWMRGESLLERSALADQGNPHGEMPRGRHRPLNHRCGSVIAAHRINGDADHGSSQKSEVRSHKSEVSLVTCAL